MEQIDQYEVWELNRGRWELVASFRDFEIANELARRRRYRARLTHTVYEDGRKVKSDILIELGATRAVE